MRQTLDLGATGEINLEGTTWWKRDGSDHFVVREVLISPEDFSIHTMDGRILSADVLDKYIQSDTPPAQKPAQPKIDLTGLDETGDTSFVVNDEQKQSKNLGTLKHSHPGVNFAPDNRHYGVPKDVINEPLNGPEMDPVAHAMIDRVLGQTNMDELIYVGVNTIDKVESGIVILANTLNVKRSELKTYLLNRIGKRIKDLVENALDEFFNAINIEPETTSPEPKPETGKDDVD